MIKPERVTIDDIFDFTKWCEENGVCCNIELGIYGKQRVEVVRCKDCKFWDGEGRCEAPENGLIREFTKPDDFCSYGERKDAE